MGFCHLYKNGAEANIHAQNSDFNNNFQFASLLLEYRS